MMRLYLVEKNGGRRLDLGTYRYNDVANSMIAARRRHPFVVRLERSQGWTYEGFIEPGPLRHPKRETNYPQQLDLLGAGNDR
jgi:hypothetical protein